MVAVAEKALDTVRAPVHVAGHEIGVSASIGVVEQPIDGTTAGELMKAADTTLYWAKADGRNRLALFDADRHRARSPGTRCPPACRPRWNGASSSSSTSRWSGSATT